MKCLISGLHVIGSKFCESETPLCKQSLIPRNLKIAFFSNSILSTQANFGEFILAKYATNLRENCAEILIAVYTCGSNNRAER